MNPSMNNETSPPPVPSGAPPKGSVTKKVMLVFYFLDLAMFLLQVKIIFGIFKVNGTDSQSQAFSWFLRCGYVFFFLIFFISVAADLFRKKEPGYSKPLLIVLTVFTFFLTLVWSICGAIASTPF